MLPVAHVRLLRKEEDMGGYVTLVFEDIERGKAPDRYIMCTMLPNWNELITIREGDIGYLSYREVLAGETTWWDTKNNDHCNYNYDATYFDKFVLDKPINETITLD